MVSLVVRPDLCSAVSAVKIHTTAGRFMASENGQSCSDATRTIYKDKVLVRMNTTTLTIACLKAYLVHKDRRAVPRLSWFLKII